MLKTKAIIAALMYTFTSLGLLVHVHFCCGGLAGISVISELSPCACDHHQHDCEGGNDCCDFETFYLDSGDDHKTPASIQVDATQNLISLVAPAIIHESWYSEDEQVIAEPRAGPPDGQPAIYLSLCSLVYYG